MSGEKDNVIMKEELESRLYGQFAEAFNALKIKMKAIKGISNIQLVYFHYSSLLVLLDTPADDEMELSTSPQPSFSSDRKHGRTIAEEDEESDSSDKYSDDTDVD